MNYPSLEEFTERVKGYFDCYYHGLTEKQIDDYFLTEAAQRETKNAYQWNIERLQNGEIEEEAFLWGCAASVAECLSLMCEVPRETKRKHAKGGSRKA